MPYSLLLGPSLALKQQNLATPEETMKVLLSDLLQVWVSGITRLEFRAFGVYTRGTCSSLQPES